MSKLRKRMDWILENKKALESSKFTVGNNFKNPRYDPEMSTGNWNLWARAFRCAGLSEICQDTAYLGSDGRHIKISIDRGVALYINQHAPRDLV
jgi:hypothetical protein